ncbi:hypothetical protein [Variovorax sp. Varisp62]|uniref:hypothetical protein n=1 Tax=Variovorax sp. Varisp62 TaxID=3243049 RepID=UPI0039B46E15
MARSLSPAPLAEILRGADTGDLDVLVDYITDSGKGRMALDNDVCAQLVRAKSAQAYGPNERMLIESELRQFGGNTVANLMRNMRGLLGSLTSSASGSSSTQAATVPYDEIVRDVAEHLKVEFDKYASTPEVEDGIMNALLAASFEKMKPDQRELILNDLGIPGAADLAQRSAAAISAGIAAAALSSVMAYHLSRSVAAASVQALLGRGLAIGATSVIARPIAVLAGPIGWAVTGAWALADMASPAYRVTVPCVVQIAYMRKKAQMNGRQSEPTPQPA